MKRQSLTEGTDATGQRVSKTIAVQQPLVSGNLMSLDVGEALIQSRDSWWLGKLGEPSGQATAGRRLPVPENGVDISQSAKDRLQRFTRHQLNNDDP